MSDTLSTAGPVAPQAANLKPSFEVWPLLGRLVLFGIGQILIVPMPRVTTYYYDYVCSRIELPDGRRLKFSGRPGDIWYVLMGICVVFWVHQIFVIVHAPWYLGYVCALLSCGLTFLMVRWIVAKTTSEDGSLQFTFSGGVWAFIGWYVLILISILTIVGWTWVFRYMLRWIARNVRGSLAFDFVAPGWEILWRFGVASLAAIFIVPIPWVLKWISNWTTSQVVVVGPPQTERH
jgi:hypothetical protein